MGCELHTFLEAGAEYQDWCLRIVVYGFEEDKDFAVKLTGTRSPGP